MRLGTIRVGNKKDCESDRANQRTALRLGQSLWSVETIGSFRSTGVDDENQLVRL